MTESLLLLRMNVNDFERGRRLIEPAGEGADDDRVALGNAIIEGSLRWGSDLERRGSVLIIVGSDGIATMCSIS